MDVKRPRRSVPSSVPTPALLGISADLLAWMREKQGRWHEGKYCYFVRSAAMRRYRGNPLDNDRLPPRDFVLHGRNGLPIANVNCVTGTLRIDEGNHRVEAMYQADRGWVPICFNVLEAWGDDWGEFEYETLERNAARTGGADNPWIQRLRAQRVTMYDYQRYWREHIELVLREYYGLELLLDLDATYEEASFAVRDDERRTNPDPTTHVPSTLRCVLCAEQALFLCGGCGNALYCGPKCQRSHWRSHSYLGCSSSLE